MALTNSYLKSVYETVKSATRTSLSFSRQFMKSSRAWSRS